MTQKEKEAVIKRKYKYKTGLSDQVSVKAGDSNRKPSRYVFYIAVVCRTYLPHTNTSTLIFFPLKLHSGGITGRDTA